MVVTRETGFLVSSYEDKERGFNSVKKKERNIVMIVFFREELWRET